MEVLRDCSNNNIESGLSEKNIQYRSFEIIKVIAHEL